MQRATHLIGAVAALVGPLRPAGCTADRDGDAASPSTSEPDPGPGQAGHDAAVLEGEADAE